MKIMSLDTDREPLIVAEVGNNHEGSFSLAEELIGLAKEAGASAVKFQTFLPEHYVSRKDHARFERLKKFQLSFQQFEKLKATADREGILFFSTPFDIESARFLGGLVDVIKISSGDNTFFPLLQEVAKTGKPIILSSGMASIPELLWSKACIERQWQGMGLTQSLAVLHCLSLYPAPAEAVGLENVRALRSQLGCTVGYSDHTLGIEIAALSVLFGARIIEKHFTKDKNLSDFRDHQLSADPSEMRLLVERVRHLGLLVGSGDKRISWEELEMARAARRSVVAAADLEPGKILEWSDLTWVRPSGGVAPGDEHCLLGRRLRVGVKQGEMLLPGQLI